MKKIPALLFILFLALLVISFFSFPADSSFSKKIYINSNVAAAGRFLFEESSWAKWWPPGLRYEPTNNGNDKYTGYVYRPGKEMFSGIDISITKSGTEFHSTANLLRVSLDSVTVTWNLKMQKTYNPLTRILNYFHGRALKKNAGEILGHLKTFLEKNENVYGIPIQQMMVTDTTLIATKNTSSHFPSITEIYALIQQLKSYVSRNNATQTNPPMLHILYDSGFYKTMVALPINKELEGNDTFLLKRMYPGKILVTAVKGGIVTTRNAMKQLDQYIDDNHLSSPAIPFESLVSNRQEEPDSTKWITKIYYPIY